MRNGKLHSLRLFIKYISAVILGLATAVLLWCVIFIFTTFPNGFEVKDFDTSIAYIKSTMPRLFVVESGSMEPAIMTGSLILTLPQQDYIVGDVISFKQNSHVVTHRVHSKTINSDGTVEYTTKGDANEEPDNEPTTYDKVLGKNVLAIPKLGEASSFAKHPVGFILMVIVPATIIVYEELKSLAKHIWAGARKLRKKRDGSSASLKHSSDKGFILSKVGIIVPAFGTFLILAMVSGAYFTDIEAAIDNILMAGEYDGAEGGTLVINEVMPDTDCSVGNTEVQWIEIYNGYSFEVNPKDFQITDGTNTIDLVTAASLAIEPGGMLLLSHNAAIWNSCWDDNGVQTGNLGGQLNIDVGELQLIDTDGTTVLDTVRWSGDGEHNPAQNESIERDPDGTDTATGTDFENSDFVVRNNPQPGL